MLPERQPTRSLRGNLGWVGEVARVDGNDTLGSLARWDCRSSAQLTREELSAIVQSFIARLPIRNMNPWYCAAVLLAMVHRVNVKLP